MSTQTFKERIWRPGTITYVAARITLSDPSTKRDSNYTTDPGASPVLYLSDKGQSEEALTTNPRGRGVLYGIDGDGKHYQPLILDWGVQHQEIGDDGSITPASGLLILANKRVAWQQKRAGTTAESAQIFVKLSQLRSDYLWEGAAIELLLVTEQFDYSPVAAGGAAVHDHKSTTIFSGIINTVKHNTRQMIIEMVEDQEWNRVVPDSEQPSGGLGPSLITKDAYPSAPDEYVGACIPMVFSSRGIDSGSTAQSSHHNINPAHLDTLHPCVITAINPYSTHHTTVYMNKWSAHGAAAAADNQNLFIYYPDSGMVGEMDAYDSWESTTEKYYLLSNNGNAAMYIPANRAVSNTGVTDPQKAIDGRGDTYAVVENGDTLDLSIPFIGPYGQITYLYTYVVLDVSSVGAGASGGTQNGEFGLWNGTTGAWHLPTNNTGNKNPKSITKSMITTSGTYARISDAWATGANEWNDPAQPFSAWRWEWSASGVRQSVYFRIRGLLAGTSLNVVAAGILIYYNPSQIAKTTFSSSLLNGNAGGGSTYGGIYGRGGRGRK